MVLFAVFTHESVPMEIDIASHGFQTHRLVNYICIVNSQCSEGVIGYPGFCILCLKVEVTYKVSLFSKILVTAHDLTLKI